MKELYQDSTGKPSGSKTWFAVTMCVILFKVIIGGVTYGDFSATPPDYAGMGVLIAAVGAVYAARNHNPKGDK